MPESRGDRRWPGWLRSRVGSEPACRPGRPAAPPPRPTPVTGPSGECRGLRDRAVGCFAAVVPSVLVMPSISVQKSGVLVTADLETGELDRWSVSAGEGIGAAVGDSASELLTVGENGRIRLLQEASSPYR